MFSCKICKIFKNTFFYRTPPVAASDSSAKVFFNKVTVHQAGNLIKKRPPKKVFSCEICNIFKNTFSMEHLRWLFLLLLTVIWQRQCRIKNEYEYSYKRVDLHWWQYLLATSCERFYACLPKVKRLNLSKNSYFLQ